MKILITGANGYLGKSLALYFAEKNHEVIALSRKHSFTHPHITWFSFELGKTLNPQVPDIDVVIHCAYDLSLIKWEQIYQTNVQGSIDLFSELKEKGNPLMIHISSISAFEGCQTLYGKAKLAIEKTGKNQGIISIRPGLIYGGENRGLIGKLETIAQKLPVIPMIGSGNYPQYLTPLVPFIQTIESIILEKLPKPDSPATLSSYQPRTLKEIIRGLSGEKRPFFIPIYWRLPWLGLYILENLGIKLPFKSDSIKSLIFSNANPDFNYMKLHKMGTEFIFRIFQKDS